MYPAGSIVSADTNRISPKSCHRFHFPAPGSGATGVRATAGRLTSWGFTVLARDRSLVHAVACQKDIEHRMTRPREAKFKEQLAVPGHTVQRVKSAAPDKKLPAEKRGGLQQDAASVRMTPEVKLVRIRPSHRSSFGIDDKTMTGNKIYPGNPGPVTRDTAQGPRQQNVV